MSPSHIIAVFEQGRGVTMGDINAGWYGDFFGQWGYGGGPGLNVNLVYPTHNKGMNFVFCDGHAKWVSVVNHPGWASRWGYPVPTSGMAASYVADWPARQTSFRIDYDPGVNDRYPPGGLPYPGQGGRPYDQ